jgi:SAM-dependent methyltransferase
MVHLEPTPARAILDMVDRLHLTKDDVFYDLGSGLGQVVILVRLLTGVRAVGIEVEPSYCEVARDRAWVLGLSGVTFVNEDARQADYAEGTVFYLFTPFMGNMLQAVLDRLCTEARKRPLRVCTYGPCTPHVARQPWLRSADANADHEFKLAIFRSV